MPEITETLYVKSRGAWRKWLEKNHAKKKDIWLIYYNKASGKPRIPYDDAVEEALCFGWIDSIVKKIDGEKHAQRYSPRNPKSSWSESNLGRARRMIEQEKMTIAGLEKLGNALNEKTPKKIGANIPKDLKEALAKKPKARANFEKFAPSYKRHYIWWVESAKQKETRARRIKRVVGFALENRKPGDN